MALMLGGIAGLTINSKLDYNNPIDIEYTLTTSTNANNTTYDIYQFTPSVNGLCIVQFLTKNVVCWHGIRALSYKDKDTLITSTTGYGLWLYSEYSNNTSTKSFSVPVQDDVAYQIQITNNSYTLHFINVIPLIQMK